MKERDNKSLIDNLFMLILQQDRKISELQQKSCPHTGMMVFAVTTGIVGFMAAIGAWILILTGGK